MALLTIFTSPKSFTDPHIALIQSNAIRSWLNLDNEVEVLVIGQEPGLAEFIAAHPSVAHLPEVTRNEQGTPLISSIFNLAREASRSSLLVYLNADILLTPEFVDICRCVAAQSEQFLLVGQRWDMDVTQSLEFASGWDVRLQAEARHHGRLHLPQGSDFFVFPRALPLEIPDFAVGRAGWDNWMIYNARQQGWSVIDLTPSYKIIHQNHTYDHLPGGMPHYTLEESDHNIELAGGPHNMSTILDADWQFIDGKIRPARPSLIRTVRALENWLTPKDGSRRGVRWALARRFRRWRRQKTGSLN